MGLAGEAGEVANKVKKVFRDDAGVVSPARLASIKDELGDVLWYVAAVASDLGVTLGDVAVGNLDKLLDRTARNTFAGSGDNR